MRYLKPISGLLLICLLSGCETAQMDRYLTPELGDAVGAAIGGIIGAKIGGTTYNGPIPIPLPSRGTSGSPPSAGYGGAGAGSVPAGVPNTRECQEFWDMVYGSCSSTRAMYGTCNVPLLQQKAAACNASGSRQMADCPAGYFNNGRTCAPLPAGATQCAVGGYCPQGTQCRPNGGCEASRDAKQGLEDIRKKIEKDNADSEQKQEVLQRVSKDLDEHRAASQNAPDGQGTAASGASASSNSGTGSPAQKAPPQTAQENPARSPGAASEPFTGEMTHPVYKKTPITSGGQGAQSASGGGASPSKSGSTTSFVQDWLDGKPVDPVKLSPEQRRKYYEQKAKEEAAARAEAARRGQAEEAAYQTTFGRASKYNTTTEEVPAAPSTTPTAPASIPPAEDDPSLIDWLSHTPARVDSDRMSNGQQPQDEPPPYK